MESAPLGDGCVLEGCRVAHSVREKTCVSNHNSIVDAESAEANLVSDLASFYSRRSEGEAKKDGASRKGQMNEMTNLSSTAKTFPPRSAAIIPIIS